jgi:hypothetical protein
VLIAKLANKLEVIARFDIAIEPSCASPQLRGTDRGDVEPSQRCLEVRVSETAFSRPRREAGNFRYPQLFLLDADG